MNRKKSLPLNVLLLGVVMSLMVLSAAVQSSAIGTDSERLTNGSNASDATAGLETISIISVVQGNEIAASIRNMYRDVLDRVPDQGGLDYYMQVGQDYLKQGKSLEEFGKTLRDSLVNSKEFQTKAQNLASRIHAMPITPTDPLTGKKFVPNLTDGLKQAVLGGESWSSTKKAFEVRFHLPPEPEVLPLPPMAGFSTRQIASLISQLLSFNIPPETIGRIVAAMLPKDFPRDESVSEASSSTCIASGTLEVASGSEELTTQGKTGFEDGAETGGHQIILYSTSWCGVCTQAREYFRSKNITIVEKDVEKDSAAMQEITGKIKTQTISVPVIDIDGKILLGFDPSAMEQILTQNNSSK